MAGMPFQAHPCWERVWVDPDMGAILPIKGLVRGGIFSSLFVAVDKKGLAHVLGFNYEEMRALVCEKMFRYEFKRCNALRLLHPISLKLSVKSLKNTHLYTGLICIADR